MRYISIFIFIFISLITTSFAADEKPLHVIIIMSDDQGGWDYGFMGNDVIETPNIDAMAQRSARLSRFYVSPVCAPTRANLMTGRYNYRTRAIDTYLGNAMMDTEEVTIAEVLKNANYATGIFGKWHLGDNYPMRPQDQGFDEVLVHRGGGIGQPSDPPSGDNKYTDPTLIHNGVEIEMKGYVTDIIFEQALKFISENNAAGKPSFTYIAPNAPHDPLHDVPEELLKKYQNLDVKSILNPMKEGSKEQLQEIDNTNRIFAMVENIDDNVGALFTHLKKIGAYENSLIFYLNDNGPMGNRFVGPHSGQKTLIEEGGIRSILLAHWPEKLKAGTINDRITAHYDLFPTILSAVGVDAPDDLKIDGIDIMPLLEGNAPNWPEREIYLQWHRGDEARPYINGAVIGQTYKISYPRNGGEARLYNLIQDPAEQSNLVDIEPKIATEFKQKYDNWFADVSSTRPNNYAAPLIHIGNVKEPISVLTQQDWNNIDGKKGGWRFGAFGNWTVLFERSGSYDIRVLYKKEKKDALIDLSIEIGDVKRQATINGGKSEYTFKDVKIDNGKLTIDATITERDKSRGVHQIYISRNTD